MNMTRIFIVSMNSLYPHNLVLALSSHLLKSRVTLILSFTVSFLQGGHMHILSTDKRLCGAEMSRLNISIILKVSSKLLIIIRALLLSFCFSNYSI